jgi:hypothetical protein
MPALTEPRPAKKRSHRSVRNGGCLPKAFERRVHLHSESAPSVVQSICNTSDHISTRFFEVLRGEQSARTGQLICLRRLLARRGVVYGFAW